MKNQSEKRASTRRMILVLFFLGAALTWFFSKQFDSLPTGARPELPSELSFIGRHTMEIQDRSRPLVVNFWATWCAPCLQELPVLVKVAKEFEKEVQFLGLSVDSPIPDVLALQGRFQISYPLAIASWELVNAWKAEQLPITYLLDQEREIIWSHRGAVSEKDLVAAINNALMRVH